MCKYFSLPGIKKLAYINANELPDGLSLIAISSAPVYLSSPSVEIPFTGVPSCVATRSNTNGAGNESVELSFQSLLPLPEDVPVSLLVTDANNRTFLIGTKEKPYPLIESSGDLGSPDGESATTTFTISYKAPKALIPCVYAQ